MKMKVYVMKMDVLVMKINPYVPAKAQQVLTLQPLRRIVPSKAEEVGEAWLS